MISVVDREMYFVNVYAYAYCALLARGFTDFTKRVRGLNQDGL